MSGELFVVGTPIGNLSDFSPRGIKTLEEVDFIAAEDTRVTLKLLNHFGIKKPMISYHEHNRAERGPAIVNRLLAGESCALVTDAGMPAVSDPGQELVKLCRENGVNVASVPGPSAVITALAISGLDVSRFSFEGFLSVNKPKRREHLSEIVTEKKTMVFYEAPHKLSATLCDLYAALGERRIALIKELTKIHESTEITMLSLAAEKYGDVHPKGEFVIIIEAKTKEELSDEAEKPDPVALAKGYIEDGLSINEAAKKAAKETGEKKSDIYKLLLSEE